MWKVIPGPWVCIPMYVRRVVIEGRDIIGCSQPLQQSVFKDTKKDYEIHCYVQK